MHLDSAHHRSGNIQQAVEDEKEICPVDCITDKRKEIEREREHKMDRKDKQ